MFFVATAASEEPFVHRRGSHLFLGPQPFRFGGTNEYWLGRGEDGALKRIPSKWAIEDGLLTAAGMGLSVVRSHSIGISTGHSDSFEPRLGVFNHSALDSADYAIAVAERAGLRLVVPLTNNGCHVAGCRQDFTSWLGITNHTQFYLNHTAIAAFRAYVEQRLNHVNPYTGRKAKDEPAILAWESGNELTLLDNNKGGPPGQWTCGLARFVKSIDANHLFLDGAYGVDPATLNCSEVDIHSNHYYPCDANRLVTDAAACERAGKPLLIGEYGWPTDEDKRAAFLRAAEETTNVVGTAFWSTFPHSDDYGFVQHGDGFTFHYPGDDDAMQRFGAQARQHSYRMRGLPEPPPLGAPLTAPIITAANATHVAWAGAALAANYSVAVRAAGSGGPWQLVCDRCASDNDTPLRIGGGGIAAGSSVQVTGYGLTGRASPASKVWPVG